jgi:hypothetical protein
MNRQPAKAIAAIDPKELMRAVVRRFGGNYPLETCKAMRYMMVHGTD